MERGPARLGNSFLCGDSGVGASASRFLSLYCWKLYNVLYYSCNLLLLLFNGYKGWIERYGLFLQKVLTASWERGDRGAQCPRSKTAVAVFALPERAVLVQNDTPTGSLLLSASCAERFTVSLV